MDDNAKTSESGENTAKKESSDPGVAPCQPSSPETITGMSLEKIIEITGEFEHLNELVIDGYFRIVQPILDLLEVEIRVRCSVGGLNQQQMKLVIQDWIDQEIKACMDKAAALGK
ncbi:MAG: hypothetical protein ABSG06_05485 [Methanoregula sp.]